MIEVNCFKIWELDEFFLDIHRVWKNLKKFSYIPLT